ncbi:MAG: MGMT family protein [archaeon]
MSWKEKAKSQKVSSFQMKVYSVVSKIPLGKVTTYGAIAKKLGASPRAVGQALRKNPFAPEVPCHRVVGSGGRIGGFKGKSCGKAIAEKISLLEKEGVVIKAKKIIKI